MILPAPYLIHDEVIKSVADISHLVPSKARGPLSRLGIKPDLVENLPECDRIKFYVNQVRGNGQGVVEGKRGGSVPGVRPQDVVVGIRRFGRRRGVGGG